VIGNQYGFIDGSWTDRMFYPTSGTFSIGDVVKVIDNGTDITGAQADSADNAEVLGIVADVISAGEETCGTKVDGVVIAYAGEMAWEIGYAGIDTVLSVGAVYYLHPTEQGSLTAIEPLDVAEVRKPMILAIDTDRVLIVNYEGVINGDYFDENPVTRLTELRDVTITTPSGGDVVYYDGSSGEWVNEPIHVALGSKSASAVITGSVTGGDTSDPGLTEVTLTFASAYPYTSLPANHIFTYRGTFAAYDYDITATSGADTGITGNIPSHEVGEFAGSFFNLDDSSTTGAVTGSVGLGISGHYITDPSQLPFINWGSATSDYDHLGHYAEIDFTSGNLTITFNVRNESATTRNFGITAWLEFLGGDVLPAT
jgi:hypothetical protein